ncbi:hypothetical protein PybrP1_008383 [[Pythium] brassicae (nom. inval.)]|nr:hypothetical protein PybrP1_008383 [[Pythium] brassicae (nom. inval.)]
MRAKCLVGTAAERLEAAYRVLLPSDARTTAVQEAAAVCAARGFSVFLHLPTGAGKSLAFQAPALAAPPGRATLVVSPLLALMHDQVSALRRKGVRAVQVAGELQRARDAPPLAQLLEGQRLVYTTPEFLLQNAEMRRWVRHAAEREAVERVVLDEAHCVLEWGNSFRPAYLELSHWRARVFASLPLTLASASVTDSDIARLAAVFHLQPVSLTELEARGATAVADGSTSSLLVVVQQLNDRANLRLEVQRKPASSAAAARTIASRVRQQPTIVYCLTRREAEDVCLALVRVGCHAGVYHGGLPRKRREFVHKQWMGGQLSIICATSAFGMGIDRADVRFVVHHSLPLSLSSYLQQIGRAGRDGDPAVCLLLFDEGDKTRASAIGTEREGLDDSESFPVSNGSSHVDLEEVAAFCSSDGCRKEVMYAHFGFPFDGAACPRNCNCGPLGDAISSTEEEEDEDVESRRKQRKRGGGGGATPESAAIPKGQIEYFHQRVLSESKRLGLPKREALSRRVVQDILERQPPTEDEMAALRGVGADRASRYFSIFVSY